jgi:hypothetical protein
MKTFADPIPVHTPRNETELSTALSAAEKEGFKIALLGVIVFHVDGQFLTIDHESVSGAPKRVMLPESLRARDKSFDDIDNEAFRKFYKAQNKAGNDGLSFTRGMKSLYVQSRQVDANERDYSLCIPLMCEVDDQGDVGLFQTNVSGDVTWRSSDEALSILDIDDKQQGVHGETRRYMSRFVINQFFP